MIRGVIQDHYNDIKIETTIQVINPCVCPSAFVCSCMLLCTSMCERERASNETTKKCQFYFPVPLFKSICL